MHCYMVNDKSYQSILNYGVRIHISPTPAGIKELSVPQCDPLHTKLLLSEVFSSITANGRVI